MFIHEKIFCSTKLRFHSSVSQHGISLTVCITKSDQVRGSVLLLCMIRVNADTRLSTNGLVALCLSRQLGAFD